MQCIDCNAVIPPERLEASPNTVYCVKCVDKHTPPVLSRMMYSHKTAGEVVTVQGKENIRLLNREYKRGR